MLPIAYVIVILCGAAGLALADYIRRKKIAGSKLYCPAGSDCEVVIYSKHSTFLGLPVETLGGLYYLIIILSYSFFLFFPTLNLEAFSFGILFLTALAFVYSVYLTFIQMIMLRQWCMWCIFSTVLCTMIYTVVWSSTHVHLIEIINMLLDLF